MSKEGALRRLEVAMRGWFWETHKPMPDVGVLLISLSRDGCDLQYMGVEPKVVIDWPALFARIIEQIQAGAYVVDDAAEVKFPSQR